MSKRIEGPGNTWAQEITARPRPDSQATLASWLLYIPGVSPAWSHYMVSIITLEDIEGVPPAVKRYPQAKYEIMVVALDPTGRPDANDPETLRILNPINYTLQFHDFPRQHIPDLGKALVKGFLHSDLPIEPEGMLGARTYIALTIQKTLAHWAEGHGS